MSWCCQQRPEDWGGDESVHGSQQPVSATGSPSLDRLPSTAGGSRLLTLLTPLSGVRSARGNMHSPTRVPASKRHSILSTSSVPSVTSYTLPLSPPSSTSASHTSHSTTPWIPYASMRAVGAVHNKIIQRRQQQSLDSQQQQVAQLPTTPRRQHIYKPATPPLLPPLQSAAEHKLLDEPSVIVEVVTEPTPRVREEQKEVFIDTQRSTNTNSTSRPTTAGKSARSRATTLTLPQPTTDQPTPPPPQPEPTIPATPLVDPLPAYLATTQPSERLTRLAQKRSAAHHSALAEFVTWQSAHKSRQRQHFTSLAQHFVDTHRSLTAQIDSGEAVSRLIEEMKEAMEEAVEDGLEAVGVAVRDCVERLVDIGWRREGEVWAELRDTVEAWNVWTIRNRRSVAELVYLVRKDELERQERLARETAEREKELAATQLAAVTTVDGNTVATVPAPAIATAS